MATIKILSITLVVQILIAATIWLTSGAELNNSPTQLLSMSPDSISSLTIAGDENSLLAFEKRGDGWQLASGLPLDKDKFERILDKLFTTKVGWPVATSDSAASRFEVAKDNYQRLVSLSGAQGTTEVYFGTSPSFRQSHVRLGSEEEIYAIEFANYEASTNEDDWFDKGLLQPNGELSSVQKSTSWELRSTSSGWLIDDQPANFEAVTDLLNRIKTLRVDNIVEKKVGEGLFELRLVDSEGDFSLLVGLIEEDSYWVSSSRRSEVFKLPAYIAQALGVEAASFSPVAEEPQEALIN
jgi:hypothetical protein